MAKRWTGGWWFNCVGKQFRWILISSHLGGGLWNVVHPTYIVVFHVVKKPDNPFPLYPPTLLAHPQGSIALCFHSAAHFICALSYYAIKSRHDQEPFQPPTTPCGNFEFVQCCYWSETNRISFTAPSPLLWMSFSDDCKPNLLSPFRLYYMRLIIIIQYVTLLCGSWSDKRLLYNDSATARVDPMPMNRVLWQD